MTTLERAIARVQRDSCRWASIHDTTTDTGIRLRAAGEVLRLHKLLARLIARRPAAVVVDLERAQGLV